MKTTDETLGDVLNHVYEAGISLRSLRGMAVSLSLTVPQGTEAHREALAIVRGVSCLLDYFDPLLVAHEQRVANQTALAAEATNPPEGTVH